MRSVVMMVLVGVMMLGVVLAQEESIQNEGSTFMQGFISERIDSFMSSLKIARGSDKPLPNKSRGRLSKENLKSIGAFQVRHKKERKLGPNGVSQVLEFLDENKTKKGTASIIYEKSQRTAQLELFKKLVVNSLPLDVVVARYAVKKDGPGDICLEEKNFDKATGKFVVDGSQVHFIRGNVAVSVRSEDTEVNAKELARQLDQILVETTGAR